MLPDLKEIRRKRKELDITQKELSKALNLSQSFIAKIETGKEIPSYNLVRKLFHYLDMESARKKPKTIDFVSKNLVTLRPNDKLSKAIRLLREFGYSQIPVLDRNTNIGTITESTVTRAILDFGRSNALKLNVSEVMDNPLSEIESHTPASFIYKLVINDGAVLVKDKGKIIGIITNSDLH